MINKIKTWFKENKKNFIISILILLFIEILPLILLPKYIIIMIVIFIYVMLLLYKIKKNQPF